MFSAPTFRRYLPLALLTMISLLAWRSADVADTDDERVDPIVYEQQLMTPVLSARRVPRTLQAPIADDAIAPAITAVLAGSPPDSCLVVEVDGRLIGEQNPLLPIVPASNEKVITTSAALSTFGAEHVFRTEVRSTGTVAEGVLVGDLYLVGGGDPFLATDAWWAQYDTMDGRAHTRLEDLADQVAAAGFTTVTGGLYGDESMFDSQRWGPWAQRLIDTRQSGPLSALSVNQNFTSWPEVFAGSFRPRVPADDPVANAIAVFTQLLAERGITVAPVGPVIAPPDATIVAAVDSPPLADVVTHVNSYSDNFGAELLLKHIGLARTGLGSTEAGASAVMAILTERGLTTVGSIITDGSGLSEDTRVTCRLLDDVLDDAGAESVLAQSLSIAGVRGSLIDRHSGTPAAGTVYAKTGTLNNVTALTGYVFSPVEPGTTLTFSYVVNGELAGQDETIRALQIPFVEQLATYPAGPALTAIAPLPPVPIGPGGTVVEPDGGDTVPEEDGG